MTAMPRLMSMTPKCLKKPSCPTWTTRVNTPDDDVQLYARFFFVLQNSKKKQCKEEEGGGGVEKKIVPSQARPPAYTPSLEKGESSCGVVGVRKSSECERVTSCEVSVVTCCCCVSHFTSHCWSFRNSEKMVEAHTSRWLSSPSSSAPMALPVSPPPPSLLLGSRRKETVGRLCVRCRWSAGGRESATWPRLLCRRGPRARKGG
jgi:hypothetical protein